MDPGDADLPLRCRASSKPSPLCVPAIRSFFLLILRRRKIGGIGIANPLHISFLVRAARSFSSSMVPA